MFNSYAETSGRAKVIIKSFGDYQVNGKKYKKDDLIAVLNDADYDIIFEDRNKSVAAKTNLLSFSDIEPSQLRILPKNINAGLAEILYGKEKESDFLLPVVEKNTSDDSGVVYLRYEIEGEDLKVYNSNRKKVNFDLGTENNVTGLEPNTEYTFSYYQSKQADKHYDIKKTQQGYFKIEITNQMNLDNNTSNIFMRIPKCGLFIAPSLSYNRGDLTNTALLFNIINGEMEIAYY